MWGATTSKVAASSGARYFNPRPPCGGRQPNTIRDPLGKVFQSTPPVWGATDVAQGGVGGSHISIHAPRVGGDLGVSITAGAARDFNPRPPCGGRHQHGRCSGQKSGHFNPRPPCGGRRNKGLHWHFRRLFQSTPPVWGATRAGCPGAAWVFHFNPRPPGGGRRRRTHGPLRTVLVQSTPPVWGATSSATMIGMASRLFQSTPPVWGATSATLQTSSARIFQSTPPVWGATHRINREDLITAPFQSTPPVWGATVVLRDKKIDGEISIHAPRVGGDPGSASRRASSTNFNPRPPCGGRPIPAPFRTR